MPIPEIPIPDFAVPYAAPIDPKIIAAAMPAKEKKGANFGEYGLSDMVTEIHTLDDDLTARLVSIHEEGTAR